MNQDDKNHTLQEKLKELRKAKGFSLDRLADLTKSSKSYLWELENRSARKPSAEKLTVIARELGVTTDYLLDDNAQPDEEVFKEAFYRKFSQLNKEDKKKVEDIVDMWSKKDETS